MIDNVALFIWAIIIALWLGYVAWLLTRPYNGKDHHDEDDGNL